MKIVFRVSVAAMVLEKRATGGPCPPSGSHRYFFRVYALDAKFKIYRRVQIKNVTRCNEGSHTCLGRINGTISKKGTLMNLMILHLSHKRL